MNTTRRGFAALLWLVPVLPAFAANSSARAFLAGLYAAYAGGSGLDLSDPGVAGRVLAPDLAKLWAQAHAADVPAPPGFDPMTGSAGEGAIENVVVQTEARGPGRASASVTFERGGRAVQVDHELVRLRAGWRIDDIHWADRGGISLRTLLIPD